MNKHIVELYIVANVGSCLGHAHKSGGLRHQYLQASNKLLQNVVKTKLLVSFVNFGTHLWKNSLKAWSYKLFKKKKKEKETKCQVSRLLKLGFNAPPPFYYLASYNEWVWMNKKHDSS